MLHKIGVIGDIHGDDARVRAALDFFRAQGVDSVLAVGDVADGPGDLQRCIDALRENDVQVVMGNHDEWFLLGRNNWMEGAHRLERIDEGAREWLADLPRTRVLDTSSGRLLLCHGVGADLMRELKPDDYGYALESNEPLQQLLREDRFRWMINGHTHTRMVRCFGNLTNLNAGKLSDRPRKGVEGGIWIVDFDTCRAVLYLFVDGKLEPHGIGHELP